MEPGNMLRDLDNAIRNVIDVDLFNRELDKEKEDAAHLEAERKRLRNVLKGLYE
jgi:hypothetical protein